MPSPPQGRNRVPGAERGAEDGLLRAVLIQGGLAACALGFALGLPALLIHLLGDAGLAAVEIDLAIPAPEANTAEPSLKRRLTDGPDHDRRPAGEQTTVVTITPGDESGTDLSRSLPAAPVAALHRRGDFGLVPGIAADGRRPAEVYARPHPPTQNASIGIVLGGLGQDRKLTEKAIATLPPEITLSFVPYSEGLQSWIDKARTAGHEVLLEIPMEPYDYPNNDPGPHTLLVANNQLENRRRLTYLMSRGAGYFGLINYQGEKFVTSERALAPLIKIVDKHGLAFFHDGGAPRSAFPALATKVGIDFAIADRVFDARPNARAIDDQFLQLEALALENGTALGAGFAYPVTVERLQEWSRRVVQRGFDLVPASRLAGIGDKP